VATHSEVMAGALAARGVQYVFSLPGGHEASAAWMVHLSARSRRGMSVIRPQVGAVRALGLLSRHALACGPLHRVKIGEVTDGLRACGVGVCF
jgi:hypothetical protein